jgi:RIO-like serine/threonine protein kinase
LTGGPVDDVPGAPAEGVPGATVEAVLKSDRYARTLRVRLADGTRAVHKTSVVVLPPGVRVAPAARRLAQREANHLARLAGVRGIPRLLGRQSPDALLREWIDGTTLRELSDVPDATFPALREVLAFVHARGVAYADLAKEENVIVDPAGAPWLVDFQISVAKGSWLGGFAQRLMKADRYHLARHVKRRRPDQLNDDDRRALAEGKGLLSRLHKSVVKGPYNLVTRRLVTRWSGAGEGRRPGEPRGTRGN